MPPSFEPATSLTVLAVVLSWACGGSDTPAEAGSASRRRDDVVTERAHEHAPPALTDAESPAVPLGQHIAPFPFVDCRYLERSSDELGERAALVVAFTSESCPEAQDCLGALGDLERELRERGVSFLALDVDPRGTIAGATARAAELRVEFPLGKDFTGAAVAALGARSTPEVVVLDGDGVLRFRGVPTGETDAGDAPASSGMGALRAALEAVLAGRPIDVPADVRADVPATHSGGCAIDVRRAEPDPTLTWSEDVAPIVEASCRGCHHPGGIAPFSLWTWSDVVKRAAMVEEVVEQQRMPPWFAAPGTTHVVNEQVLEPEERDTILAWIRAGAPRGEEARDDSDDPPPPPSERTWRIAPDLILRGEDEVRIPASGFLPYERVDIEYEFQQDTWIDQIEMLPTDPQVLHHATLTALTPRKDGSTASTNIYVYVPGGDPRVLDPGVAMRIPRRSRLRMMLHYTPKGSPTRDRVSVGLHFPRTPVRKRYFESLLRDHDFEIPAGHPAYEITGHRTVREDVTLIGAYGHMHLRGKDMVLTVVLPDGTRDPLLTIGNYDFDWQRDYRFAPGAKRIPAGSRFEVVGRFDNSAFNPYGPDPDSPVGFGLSTDDEMMYCWVSYTKDAQTMGLRVDPHTGARIGGRPMGRR